MFEMRTVALDLCDTLVQGNTTFIFLDSYFSQNKKYKWYIRLKKTFLVRLFFKITYKFGFDINRRIAVGFLKNISKQELLQCAADMIGSKFVFNSELIDVINFCKKNNIPVVIVSASLDFIVEAVAEYLNIQYYASRLLYKDDVCMGGIELDLLFSKKKIIDKLTSDVNQNLFFVSDNREDAKIIMKLNNGFGFYTQKNSSFFQKCGIKKFDYNYFVSSLTNQL